MEKQFTETQQDQNERKAMRHDFENCAMCANDTHGLAAILLPFGILLLGFLILSLMRRDERKMFDRVFKKSIDEEEAQHKAMMNATSRTSDFQ